MKKPPQLVGLPDYYRFPSVPDGIAVDAIYGDATPYHELAEDTVVVFIKSHYSGFADTCLGLDRSTFAEQYILEAKRDAE